ncbi:ATP-binding protein [Streptomyces sp. NBC_00878]|uniref:ATP-binding protein n=1 Tax=Streptomyces sp. NBC_00878 TaxID=2975854 RepID=UPI00225853C8|nr:ATP-binding protein [Streptomyces sp. NBC_00878]MCX4906418.1 ATP-binding protein [Streptomyces sp. NBC_00878]
MSTASLLELELLAFPKAVPDLRRTVRRHLGGPCDDVQLCVTELVGNVVRHVGEGTPVRVRVAGAGAGASAGMEGARGGRIRIEVSDPDPRALPVLLCAAGDDESGRGLALLDAVALRWGVEQGATGKTVWCELGETW